MCVCVCVFFNYYYYYYYSARGKPVAVQKFEKCKTGRLNFISQFLALVCALVCVTIGKRNGVYVCKSQ